MLTSKQRAYLRSLSNGLDTIFQIGKAGITPEIIETVDRALEVRELVKLKVLDTSMLSASDAAITVSGRTRSEIVQVIGTRFVIYRRSKKKPVIDLPK